MKLFLASLLLLGSIAVTSAATTINLTNKLAYGANLGWMDWRGDTNSGAVIGEYVCSGYIYAANVGWINLGGGAPTNGIQYQNLSAGDFGVNHDGVGNLRGFAYGANIGWVNFESNGAAKVDLKTGKLSGSIYSANCGWIGLSNAFAFVQTGVIAAGADIDSDGIADAYERTFVGNLSMTAAGDLDGDGLSNLQEYLAGTNPNDANDRLVVTAFTATPGGTQATVTWKSTPTRGYYLQASLDVVSSLWFDSGLGIISSDGTSTTRGFTETNAPIRFYRVQALKPLSP